MEIKDLKTKFFDIQKMAGALNKTKLVKNIKTVAIKRDDLIELFLKGVESVPPDKEVELPKEIATFYNALVGKLEGDDKEVGKLKKPAETKPEEEAPDECPVFKKGWKENNEECQTCLKDFPDDYKECMEACQQKAKEPSKGKKKGPGVIATILEIIEQKGPISREKILTQLSKKIPDRDADRMAKTIQAQIGGKKRPLRMEKEKGIKFTISKEGEFSLKG